jgi:membrane protease YdiL (CAAX protease family)
MEQSKVQTTAGLGGSLSGRYLAVAYGFSWLVWLPAVLASYEVIPEIPWPPLFAIGTCGPLVGALACIQREAGWAGVRSWLKRGFTSKISWPWWLLILLLPFAVPALALLIFRLTGGESAAPLVLTQPVIFFPTALLMLTIGGGQEEYGWRGYLLPRLDERWKPWQTDLVMILVHVCWHLPLFLISYTAQSQYPFWLLLAFGIGFTPLINRIYRQTGSILAAILFHGFTNTSLDLFPPVGAAVNHSWVPLLLVGLLFGLVAAVLQRE